MVIKYCHHEQKEKRICYNSTNTSAIFNFSSTCCFDLFFFYMSKLHNCMSRHLLLFPFHLGFFERKWNALYSAECSVENPDHQPGPLERQFSNTAAESFQQELCEQGVIFISPLSKEYMLCSWSFIIIVNTEEQSASSLI